MIRALILKKALLTVESGSIVNISESQFKALGGIAVAYKEEDKAEEVSEAPEESEAEAPEVAAEESVEEEKAPEKKSEAKKASSSKGKRK